MQQRSAGRDSNQGPLCYVATTRLPARLMVLVVLNKYIYFRPTNYKTLKIKMHGHSTQMIMFNFVNLEIQLPKNSILFITLKQISCMCNITEHQSCSWIFHNGLKEPETTALQ